MSFERVPPKSEVMGWSPHRLADFLRTMNLSGSDKVVLQSSMNGARFLSMTENDVLKFPKLHAPLISKICSEMNKKDERRGLFNKKTTTTKFREPDTPVEELGWGEDEFSDDDYEDPDLNEEEDADSVGDYESPTEEQEENDYEPNPSDATEDFPQVVRPSLPIGEGDYIDNVNNHSSSRSLPPVLSPRPNLLAPTLQVTSLDRRDQSPFRDKSPRRAAMGPAPPQPPKVERSKKPTRERGDNPPPNPQPAPVAKFNSMERVRPSTLSVRTPKPPLWTKPLVPPGSSTSVGRSNSSVRAPSARPLIETRSETPNQAPAPRNNNTFPLNTKGLPPRPVLPGLQPRQADSLPLGLPPSVQHGAFPPHGTTSVGINRSASSAGRSLQAPPPRPALPGLSPHSNLPQPTKDMDPSWYVGKIQRVEADHCLRQEHKDGSYLVRDSTKQRSDQPFTLMVLYQDKVYNIQIRMQNNQYLLGTGMKVHEAFPTVRAMIGHYSQTPLLLIDAKNRNAANHNQCFLSYPAGYGLT